MKQTYELNKRRIHSLGLTADLKDDNGKVHHFIDGYEHVEIGGIKWATCNVGANKETDSGLYFQWGDVKGYTAAQVGCGHKYFGWINYKFSLNGIYKYNRLDGLTKLEPCDDAATVNMGKSWRMPSKDDYNNLFLNTTSRWVKNYQGSGIDGRLFISNEDSSKVLFFPACGYCESGRVNTIGEYGFYWSNSLSANFDNSADFYFSKYLSSHSYNSRFYGFSVRGVINE